MTSVFLAPRDTIAYVYGEERERAIYQRTNGLLPESIIEPCEIENTGRLLADADVVFSTWGMPALTPEQIDAFLPKLKAVFYAAGSVQSFAAPFLERGITVVSAWRANAAAVAQFTAAQIVLAMKGYFRNVADYDGDRSTYEGAFRGRGVYGETVGLLGVGAIGRLVIEALKVCDVRLLVWDPFLSDESAAALGVEKVDSLDEIFSRSYVVSNHVADKQETAGLITAPLFEMMRENATFINTGRGRTVDEGAMIAVLTERTDLTALIDVTFPEPPGRGSALMRLPNIRVSTHIAGTIGDEVRRMADLCIREFDRFAAGQPLEHAVTFDVLKTMA